jgi:hypothetical protein
MKSFKEYVLEKKALGLYVCVRFTQESNDKLKEYAISLGLDPIDDFHATVVYSEKPLNVPHGTLPYSDTLTPVGVRYLGDVGSEYRAVALEVTSEGLQSIFDNYVDNFGYENRFDGYLQHVSLAYKPREDIDSINSILPNFTIQVDRITVAPLKKD